MEAGIQNVIAMSYSITVSAAKILMKEIYTNLFDEKSLPIAISKGRRRLYKDKERKASYKQTIDLEDWLLPVVYQNRPFDPNFIDSKSQEDEAYYKKRELRHKISHRPNYGFFGRDLDILVIEKHLLKHNMLLLKGMGGSGKSTLLDYLASWWEKTGFVKQSFYFGYDERTYTLEQILFFIARKIFDEKTFANFSSSNFTTQKWKIVDHLRSKRFCLILDNCESITGSSLAIKNVLEEGEKEKLKSFLQELTNGKSFVIFGSRGEEAWLRNETFKNNIHNLKGLDLEARSDFAFQILNELDIKFPEKYSEFHRLMKLLAGYPLAMEVILPNLKNRTSIQIIDSLKAGDVDLERNDGKDKTESILKCVDYSHSNISEDAKKLLIFLAPFNSIINLTFLPQYTEQLKQFPSFKDYPFELWESVISETVNWGLMEPLSFDMPIMNLQPVFPYFLQIKLEESFNETQKEELKQAFMNHYNGVASIINDLFNSKEAEKKKMAHVLAELEYENIYNALIISLQGQKSIINTYFCLSQYNDITQNHKRGLLLGQMVLEKIKAYPSKLLEGWLGAEFGGVIDNIAKRFLLTKQYVQAKGSYFTALEIIQNLTIFEEKDKAILTAGIYHQLGRVAQGLREFEEARKNYEKALEIKIEFNARYEQASTYHQLGRVAQELREFEEARKNYKKALEINIEFKDRYEQASTYHQLGIVAQELREYEEARKNYKKALEINIEFNARFEQASTYHQLGRVAEELREYEEARKNYKKALEIYIEFNAQYEQEIVIRSLERLENEIKPL